MPIYDYQCDECGHLFEVTKKRSEPGPAACPTCGAADPRRTISATSFQLKGSGWYVTDYKGAKPAAATSSEASESSDSSSGSDDSGSSSSGGESDNSTSNSTNSADVA